VPGGVCAASLGPPAPLATLHVRAAQGPGRRLLSQRVVSEARGNVAKPSGGGGKGRRGQGVRSAQGFATRLANPSTWQTPPGKPPGGPRGGRRCAYRRRPPCSLPGEVGRQNRTPATGPCIREAASPGCRVPGPLPLPLTVPVSGVRIGYVLPNWLRQDTDFSCPTEERTSRVLLQVGCNGKGGRRPPRRPGRSLRF
jgi:hypothetical protein